MASVLQNVGDETVLFRITHSNLKHHFNELRFSLHSTVGATKERLWKNCGTAVDSMLLQLFDDNDKKIADMSEDSRPLGFYSPYDGYRIHVLDLDPASVTAGGWLEDTSLVEKFSISEDAYDKLDGTFRKFKERVISQNPYMSQPKVTDDYMENLAVNIKVGDRCEVDPGGKRGAEPVLQAWAMTLLGWAVLKVTAMPTTYLSVHVQPRLSEGVLCSTDATNSNIRLHQRFLRISNSIGSIPGSNRVIPNSYGFYRKWRIMASNDVVGEEKKNKKKVSVEENTQKKSVSKGSNGKGFGSPKSVSSASERKKGSKGSKEPKERTSSNPIIRRAPLEKPFAVPQGDPKIEENEGAFLLTWAALGILILVEGFVLAASGFLPEEWDNFLVKYLYPSFTPTVAVFVAGTAAYGLYKYLGGGSQKS